MRLQCWAMPAEWDSEYRAVVAFADQQLAIARARKDRITETGLLTCRGFHQQLLGNMDQAKADYQQALVLARRLGDRLQEADILSFRGDMYAYQGSWRRLMELIEAHKRFGVARAGWQGAGGAGPDRQRLPADGALRAGRGLFQGAGARLRHPGDQERLVDIRPSRGCSMPRWGV